MVGVGSGRRAGGGYVLCSRRYRKNIEAVRDESTDKGRTINHLHICGEGRRGNKHGAENYLVACAGKAETDEYTIYIYIDR